MKSIYKKYFVTAALIWASCFVIFLLLYIFVVSPHQNDRKRLNGQLAEAKKVYQSAQIAATEERQSQLSERTEIMMDRLSDFVIDFSDSANLIFDISSVAKQKEVSSFSINRISHRDSSMADCKYICENHIQADFDADFNHFAFFLNALERHRPVVFVDNFTITRSSRDDSKHQVKMKLAVFVRKDGHNQFNL